MGHGDHWEAVEKDYKNFVATMLPLVCKEGELVGTHTFYPTDAGGESKEALVCGFQYPAPESPVSFLALVVSRSERDHMIESAYPVFSEGAASRLIVDEVKPSSNGIEGTVEAYLPQGDMICFFDPFFFLNKERYAVGEGIDVALSALAYGLEKFEFSPSEIDERENCKSRIEYL